MWRIQRSRLERQHKIEFVHSKSYFFRFDHIQILPLFAELMKVHSVLWEFAHVTQICFELSKTKQNYLKVKTFRVQTGTGEHKEFSICIRGYILVVVTHFIQCSWKQNCVQSKMF